MNQAGGTAAGVMAVRITVTQQKTASTADSSTRKVASHSWCTGHCPCSCPAHKPSWWARHPLTWLTSSRCSGQPAPGPTGGTRRIPPELQGHGPGKANSWSPSLLISQDDFLNGWERRGEGQQDGPKLLKHLPMAPMKNTQWSVKSVWICHVEERHLTG